MASSRGGSISADEAFEHQVASDIGKHQAVLARHLLRGDGDDAEPRGGERLDGAQPVSAIDVRLRLSPLPVAHVEDALRRPLHVERGRAVLVGAVQARHVPVRRIERNLVEPRIPPAQVLRIRSGFAASNQQGALQRIAVDNPAVPRVAQRGIVAQRRRGEDHLQGPVALGVDIEAIDHEAAVRRIPDAADVHSASGRHDA